MSLRNRFAQSGYVAELAGVADGVDVLAYDYDTSDRLGPFP